MVHLPAMAEQALMSPDEITSLFAEAFKGWRQTGMVIEAAGRRYAKVRMAVSESALRPGGTVSGPTMFALADTAIYVAVLASVGPKALAVTTNMSINFLRKPAPRDIVAECRLLKLGKRLAVGEVTIFSEGEEEPVAHATGTYSIPPGVA